MNKVTNARTLPRLYFGLHMVNGVAEYSDPGEKPYRILVGETTIKNMDPSFQGRPVYVRHVDEVDLSNLTEEADGYVVRSFYNEFDGKHWVEFLVVSDKAHDAIQKGWLLSNAYVVKNTGPGGLWHGVEYAKEVIQGEYDHLAIVPNPRYAESKILTPEQFRSYNEQKELELKRVANSKAEPTGDHSMLKFFKRTKVENETDLAGVSVVLPESQKEMTITALVEAMDKVENMHGYANGDHMVKMGDEEMSVNDMIKKYGEACNALAEIEKAKNDAADADKDKDKDEEKRANAAADKAKADEAAKLEAEKNADILRNAAATPPAPDRKVLELGPEMTARGKARYGSGK